MNVKGTAGLGQEQVDTPIIHALATHAANEKISLHVPGHHQGRVMPAELAHWLGQATKLDVTELPGLDNLHQVAGCIRESQALAARHYGSKRCFYSVNGATACVMAAVAACVEDTGRGRIVLLGPCHMSVWRGLVHADAEPVVLPSAWRRDLQTFGRPSVHALTAILQQTTDIAAVFVTSPTYQGLVAPIAQLAAVAHQFRVPLIVDEAHGAHLGLHDSFPHHSVHAGADVIVHSPHKTLPCLTQAAWVHVQGDIVTASTLERSLLFLQTTSPSYLLLAALDGAQAWLRGEGHAAAHHTVTQLAAHRELTDALQDPMRLWVPTGSEQSSRALDEQLRKQGIYVEYADATGVLAIFGFSQPDYEYDKFFRILQDWKEQSSAAAQIDGSFVEQLYVASWEARFVCSPRAVMRAHKRQVPLAGAAGNILADPLAPYPPGVPALWPGQELSQAHVELLQKWRSYGGIVTGITEDGYVEVVNDHEARVFCDI